MKKTFHKALFTFLNGILLLSCMKEKESLMSANPHAQYVPLDTNQNILKPDHILIVIEENHSYEQIIGSDSAPYINSLLADPFCISFTQSHSISYGSQPNYLALYSGSTQDVNSGRHPLNAPFTTPNLGRQFIDSGYSFATYSEGLPEVGYNGDSMGLYVRRHNPATNWMGTSTNQIPPTTNQPFTAFPSDYTQLPTVSFVIPDLNNDMHNGTIT
jgi:phosphatidylinositol-3-phosphatase